MASMNEVRFGTEVNGMCDTRVDDKSRKTQTTRYVTAIIIQTLLE